MASRLTSLARSVSDPLTSGIGTAAGLLFGNMAQPGSPGAAPPAPTMGSAEVDAAAAEERRRARLARGRASTILAGELVQQPSLASKILTGQ